MTWVTLSKSLTFRRSVGHSKHNCLQDWTNFTGLGHCKLSEFLTRVMQRGYTWNIVFMFCIIHRPRIIFVTNQILPSSQVMLLCICVGGHNYHICVWGSNLIGGQLWCQSTWRRCVIETLSSLIARFMGPIWGQKGPGGPHVGPMNFAFRVISGLMCREFSWHGWIPPAKGW